MSELRTAVSRLIMPAAVAHYITSQINDETEEGEFRHNTWKKKMPLFVMLPPPSFFSYQYIVAIRPPKCCVQRNQSTLVWSL